MKINKEHFPICILKGRKYRIYGKMYLGNDIKYLIFPDVENVYLQDGELYIEDLNVGLWTNHAAINKTEYQTQLF